MVDNNFMVENNVPLTKTFLNVLYEDLDWSEFEWGTDFLQITNRARISGLKTLKWYDNTV